jgi:hypothetical protein
MNTPSPDGILYRLLCLAAYSRGKAKEQFTMLPPRHSWPKGKSEKIKFDSRVLLLSLAILAVDDFRFLWMQPQLARTQSVVDLHKKVFCLRLRLAMYNDVVGIPFKGYVRKRSRHPLVKRIVQKQIGQQGTYDASLRCAASPFVNQPSFVLRRSFQPPFDVQAYPCGWMIAVTARSIFRSSPVIFYPKLLPNTVFFPSRLSWKSKSVQQASRNILLSSLR